MALRILHFSDIHTGGHAETFSAYFDKRIVGVFNYCFRRRFIHDMQLLNQFIAHVIATPPDLLVCTGDLTSTSQCGEFDDALLHLKPIIEAKIPIIYIPGNHDYYTNNKKCVSKMKSVFEILNAQFNLKFDDLPQQIIYKNYSFLLANESYPTGLISSCGYLKKKDSDFICKKVNNQEFKHILIGHYPLIEQSPVLRFRHRLWGQNMVIPLLLEGKISISLNGHIHAPYVSKKDERILECCASSLTRTGHFAEIIYNDLNDDPQVKHYEFKEDKCVEVVVEERNINHL